MPNLGVAEAATTALCTTLVAFNLHLAASKLHHYFCVSSSLRYLWQLHVLALI